MSIRMQHGDDDLAENHEINVTPFIDVMLVLLIIFMVAAPLATVDINVDLPASNAAPQPEKSARSSLASRLPPPMTQCSQLTRRNTESTSKRMHTPTHKSNVTWR